MRRAVVAGGSVAGLLAARVLHDLADEVLVVEPDECPDRPGARPGTPHADQWLVLLGVGQHLLEHWFPGVLDALVADGAVRCPTATDARLYVDGRPRAQLPGEVLLPVLRPLLEWHLRARVLALPRVRAVRGRVTGLTAGRGRVDGVHLAGGGTGPGTGTSAGAVIGADLVVDATGRASRVGTWLERLGYPAPLRRRLRLDLGYATGMFTRAPGQRLDGVLMAQSVRGPLAERPGVSCLAPWGADRWHVVVSGYGADRPTRDPGDFLLRCRYDPAAPFGALVGGCAPVGPVTTYRFAHSVRRDFHLLRRLPAGLVAVGDALASFNPIHGQGVPSAALHASALGGWLRRHDPAEPAVDYFRRAGVLVEAAWQASAISDCRLPHVTGERPRGHRLMLAVSGLLDRASSTDPVVARRLLDVIHMREHPNRLLAAAVLARAVRAGLRG